MNLQQLIDIDKGMLLFFNGGENMFLDRLVLILTMGYTWIPLYCALLYLVVRNNEKWTRIFLIIGAVGLGMLISNGLNGGFVKPFIGRLRPSVEPSLSGMVHLIDGYTGGGYSFFSAHACNTFTIAVFFSLLVRSRMLSIFLFLWAVLNCWTRLYLAVHYPSDIMTGIVMGMAVGIFVYLLYKRVAKMTGTWNHYISTQYTRSGYSYPDIDLVLTVLVLTLCYAALHTVVSL